jgi:hypothetical protein
MGQTGLKAIALSLLKITASISVILSEIRGGFPVTASA